MAGSVSDAESRSFPATRTDAVSASPTGNRRRHPLALILPLLAVVGLAGYLGYAVLNPATPAAGVVAIGRAAPLWTLPTLDGKQHLSLAQYRGRPVVVNFWASWCQPCQQEAALLAQAGARYSHSAVAFVGIDEQENSVADGRSFQARYGISYPSVYDAGGDADTAYGVTGFPETFFIAPNGTIKQKYVGPLADMGTLDHLISQIDGTTAGR